MKISFLTLILLFFFQVSSFSDENTFRKNCLKLADIGNYIKNDEFDGIDFDLIDVNLAKNILFTEDAGYDEKTDKKVWGSDFGPLIFKKIDNFDYFIEQNWE